MLLQVEFYLMNDGYRSSTTMSFPILVVLSTHEFHDTFVVGSCLLLIKDFSNLLNELCFCSYNTLHDLQEKADRECNTKHAMEN